ncbi:MAG: cyclic nucleotide-binding domain-containing protein [Magnetococcales bacterium]|nr:cyclic nucleotide-binding domain-containing protein [Magnetococcales bacterium]MBF0322149.1 cyclic nucleotide-binding domain-containing protein [Magnetococcales bacterium]
MEIDVRLFSQISLFNDLTADELKMVVGRCAQVRDFAPGQVIFQEGAPGSGVYCLLQGRVQVEIDMGGGGSRRTLATITGPDIFGEVAFLDGSPRSATTIAQEKLTLYILEKEKMLALMGEATLLGYRIMSNFSRILADKVRRSNHALIQEARKLHSVQSSAMPLAARKYQDVSQGYTTQVWV